MAEPFVTFVVPTLGRATLGATLRSLHDQTDQSWRAVAVYDDRARWMWPDTDRVALDSKITAVRGRTTSAGLLRNVGCAWVGSPWTAFVDDDDTVSTEYVSNLAAAIERDPGADLVFTHMDYPDGRILPRDDRPDPIAYGNVGINFAVRTVRTRTTPFVAEDLSVAGGNEDWAFVDALVNDLGVGYVVTPSVDYHVRPHLRETP